MIPKAPDLCLALTELSQNYVCKERKKQKLHLQWFHTNWHSVFLQFCSNALFLLSVPNIQTSPSCHPNFLNFPPAFCQISFMLPLSSYSNEASHSFSSYMLCNFSHSQFVSSFQSGYLTATFFFTNLCPQPETKHIHKPKLF